MVELFKFRSYMFEMENNKAIKTTISSPIRIRRISSISRFSRRFFETVSPSSILPFFLCKLIKISEKPSSERPSYFYLLPHYLFFVLFYKLPFLPFRSLKSKPEVFAPIGRNSNRSDGFVSTLVLSLQLFAVL